MQVSLGNSIDESHGLDTFFTFVDCDFIQADQFRILKGAKVKFLDRLPRLSSHQSFHSIFISEQWLIARDFPSLKKFLDHYDRYAIFIVAEKKSIILAEYANEFLIEDILQPVECIEPIILKLTELAEKKRNYSIQMIGQSHEISLYRRALDQSASAIEITDANGVIVYVNDQFEESSGYTSAELIGQKASIVASGRMDELLFKNLWDTITAGQVWKGEFENRRKDGTLFYQRATIRPVQGAKGEISHFIAVKDDVSSLKENELTKEFIINAANIATWDWDIKNDDIDYNDKWAALIGFGQKELGSSIGLWQKLLHPDDKERVLKSLNEHLELKSQQYDSIYRLKHKSGEYVWIHDTGKVIATDKNGKATRMAGVHVDVTDLMQTQEALSVERDQLAQTQQVARTGSCFFNFRQGCFTYFSDVARELVLLPETGDIQFDQILNKIPSDEIDMVKGHYEKMLKGEDVHLFHRVRNEEDYIWLKIEVTPIEDASGEAIGMLAVIQDVTDLKTQIKTISDQNQQLSESHEMAQMGGWTLNLMTNQAQWSKQLLLILGEDLGLEEHDSDRYIAKIHPEDRAKAIDVFQEAKKTGTSYTQYYRLLLEDEEIKFAEERGWFIFDDEGRAIEARGITKDITQGVNANRLNEIQEQRLSAAAEIAGLGYWELNLASGEVFWSDELFDLFELDQKKDVASWDKYVSLMHPDDISMSPEEFHQALYKGSFKNEHRMLLDSGRIIYLEEVADVEFDEDGHPKIVRGVSHDVTESKLKSIRLEKETIDHRRAQKLAGIGHFKLYYPSGLFEWSVGIYDIIGVEQTDERLTFDEIAKRVSPEDAMRIQNSIEASLTSGERGGVVHRLIRDDNSIRMLDVKWEPFYNELNEPEGILGTCHDITEIWEAQNKLVEAEKIAQMGHWSLDYKSGELFWSDQVYQIFDKEPQEFPATYEAFLGYVHPDDREMVNEVYTRSVDTKSLYEVDHRLLVNGKVKYVSEKAVTQYDDKGKPIKSIGTVQDITEKKIAQNKADKASKRLGMLVESIPDLIFVYDREGRYIDYFESAFDQPLVPPEVFMGKHYSEVLPISIAQKVDKFLPLALGTGEVQKFPFQLDKEGAEKWYQATMSPYRDGEEIVGVTIVNRDITKEKVYENQLVDTKLNLELILNSLDKLLCIVDEDGRCVDLFYAENGIKPIIPKEEIIGKKWQEVIPPDIHHKIDYAFKLVDKKNISTEVSYSLTINNVKQYFEASIAPFKDERKGVKGYTVLVSDITDRKKAKKLLKKSEERFKKHSEFLPHILWTRNQRGDLTYMNAKGKEYYGKYLKKINKLAKDPLYVIHPQDRATSKRLWNKANKNKTSFQNLERRKDSKGVYRWFNIKVDPIFDNEGGFVSWIGVATDVDKEQKVARENEDLVNNLKERIKEAECMYAISHLAEKLSLSLDLIFEEAVEIIPNGFQYPGLTKAQIIYNDKYYGKTVLYRNKRVLDLKVRDSKVGEIVVGVSAKSPNGQLNYFLKEEERLLEAIADNLSLILTQKLDQLVLAESEKRFKSLFDSASIGIIIQDLPALQIVDVNHAMSALLHYDRTDLLGLTLLDLSPPHQGDLINSSEKFEEVHKSTSGGFFWQLLDNFGQNIHCAININTLDIEGKQYQVSFIRNVSDEMAAYTALENSEELYRNIFENIQEGYYLRDLDGKIINVNPEGLRILEASEDQVAGHSAAEFFMHDNGEELTFVDKDNNQVVQDLQVRAKTPQGKQKYLSINKKLITSNDAPWVVECSFRDITQSVLLSKLQTLTLALVDQEHISSDQVMQKAVDEVPEVFGAGYAFFHFVDAKEKEVRYSTFSKDSGIKTIPHTVPFNKIGYWAKVLEGNEGVVYNNKEVRFAARRRKDGQVNNAMVTPIIIKGEVVAVIGVCNRSYDFSEMELNLLKDFGLQFYSIYDQVKTQDAYLTSLDNLERSQEAGKIGAWTYDVVFDETWWSDIMFDLYGIDKSEGVPADNWVDFTHPDDRDMHIKAFEDAFASGNFECEYRLVTPTGEIRHLKAMADIIRGEDGVPVKFNGFVQDVTAIKKAEKAILDEKQKFENIVDALPGIVYRLSLPEINLEYISDHTQDLLGISSNLFANAKGEDFIRSLVHDDDWEEVRKIITIAIDDVDTYSLIHRMKKEDGRYVWVSNTGKVSLTANNTLSIEGFIYDVTDRIKNEERVMNAVMEASDKEKSRISKEIHDSLQQTLTIASLNLEFVKKERDKLSDLAREKLGTGWEFLKKSMDDSRSIAHRLMPKAITDFGVVPVIKDMFEELNRSGDIQFEFITNFEERIKIPAATNIYKVVQEAVNNIFKHSKAKTVTVQYMLLNDTIQLSIEDDGVGFGSAKIGNCGFGLASMKSRATALSAEMIIDSFPGHGTTIVLDIPFNENIKYYE